MKKVDGLLSIRQIFGGGGGGGFHLTALNKWGGGGGRSVTHYINKIHNILYIKIIFNTSGG